VATFKVISGMSVPPDDTPARVGYQISRELRCFSCHGVAGSGGLPNPRSLAGFIPGWYGPDFDDLVRNREEFDSWVRQGSITRLEQNAVASFFIRRQKISMPAYQDLRPDDLLALWEYTRWLQSTNGGYLNTEKRW